MSDIKYIYRYFKDSDTPKLLEYLMNDGTDKNIINNLIEDGINNLDNRLDCSDFRAAIFIRILYLYNDRLDKNTKERIINSLKNYPYTDKGSNSLCTWTENHRITIYSTAYLLGELNKELVDINSGLNLYDYFKKEVINFGLNIMKYGIEEYSSNIYYPVLLSSISNIIEFSDDEYIRDLYTCILDTIVFDILSKSIGYYFNVSNARSYIDNKTNTNNYMENVIRSLLGEKINILHSDESCFISFMNNKKYIVPSVFKEIYSLKEKEILTSNSLDIDDLKELKLLEYSESNVRYLMQQGLISESSVINNSIRYIKEHEMSDHPLFKYLRKYINGKKKNKPIWGDNAYLGKGNSYTYIKNNYELSCLENYHIGMGSSQQSTNVVSIDDLSIFTLSPYKNKIISGSRNYWTGSKVNGYFTIYKNMMFGIYDTCLTHMYFPIEKLEKFKRIKNYLFGRYHDTNVCIISNKHKLVNSRYDNAIKIKNKMNDFKYTKYDFINNCLRKHYYIIIVDDEMSFDDFIEDTLSKKLNFNNNIIEFDRYKLIYKDGLYLDNKKVIHNYKLYSNNYCSVKDNIIKYSCNDKFLNINLDTFKREYD